MDLARLTPQSQAVECGEFSPLLRRRLVAVEGERASGGCPEPLDASLLWRQVAQAVKAVTSPFHYPQVPVRLAVNPKGIPSHSPGLARSAYPGEAFDERATPTGLWPGQNTSRHNPVGVEARFARHSQGSSCLATLGFAPESLWDSQISAPKLWVMERTSHRTPNSCRPCANSHH